MAVRTSRLSMASVSHIGGFRQGGEGASVPIFGQSKTGGFLRPPASIECRCATFSATVSAAPPQADPSAVSVLRRNTFSVCLSPASRGRQRFRFSSWHTHIRLCVNRYFPPHIPSQPPPECKAFQLQPASYTAPPPASRRSGHKSGIPGCAAAQGQRDAHQPSAFRARSRGTRTALSQGCSAGACAA